MSKFLVFISCWLLFVGVFFTHTERVFAASGDITITVTNQLGSTLTGSSATVNCNGVAVSVTDGGVTDADLTDNGSIRIAAATLIVPSCLTNGESITQLDVAKDGYVTTAATGDLVWNSGAENNNSAALNFGHKVTGQTELGGSLTGATVTVGGTSCTESSGVYYCATPVASDGGSSDVIVTKDGYVTYTANSTNRSAGTTAQATYTSSNSFGYKITAITTEVLAASIVSSVTSLTVGDATGQDTCTLSGGAWYCPVLLADSDAEPTGTATLDGYVSAAIDLTGTGTRSLGTSAQVSTTITGVKYSHKVTGQTELAGSLTGATVTVGGTSCTESSGVYYCATPLASDGGSSDVVVTKDGYVTYTANSTNRTAGTTAQATYTSSNQFSHKVTGQTELAGSLTGATVTVGGTSCTESSGVYYCATPLASDGGSNDVIVVKDGYVTYTANSTNRATNATAQATYTSANQFGHKVTGQTELAGSLTGATVTVGGTSCTESTGVYYCATPLASDGGSSDVIVTKDGYVTYTTNSTNRTTNATAQATYTSSNQFSHKVTGQTELAGSLTGATVTVGGTSCTESSGVYYCATPLASDGGSNDVIVVKDGYVTYTANSTNRTTNATAQATYTSSNQFAYKITAITTEVLAASIVSSVTSLTVGDGTGQDACTLSGGAWYCPVLLADSDAEPTGTATLDGYVSAAIDLTGTGTRSTGTSSQVSTTITGVKYSHKVTGQTELAGSLTGATVTVGGTSCTESSGVYYCATPVASDGGSSDVIVTKDGYVTYTANSTNRSAGTTAQATYTSSNKFGYKITGITTEALSASIVSSVTSLTVGDATGQDTCTLSGGAWYCPVLLANSDVEPTGTSTLDGYITEAIDLTSTGTRTSGTDTQVSTTITEIKYSHKVTGQTELAGSLTGATVTVGGTSCTESSGVYYCATPLANDGGSSDVIVTKDGYVTYTANSTNRTTNATAQATYTSSNQFSHKVTGQTELGVSLTAATVTVGGTSCTESSGVYYCATPLASDGGSSDVIIAKDGYVTYTANSTNRTTNATAQAIYTSANQFAHKVTGQTELGASLTGATVTVGGTSCTESSGVYYCATPVASDGGSSDVIVTKDGYVTYTANSTNRTLATTAQATYTSSNQFAYKITGITTEALSTNVTASVAALTVGDATGQDTCTLSSGAWYCPVLLADSDAEPTGTPTLDGYVSEAIDLTGTGTRTSGTDSQVSTTITGVKYSHKVTGQTELAGSLTGATVTVGGTSCTESSGVYYCATPLAADGGSSDVIVVKNGYLDYTTNSTNRTTDTTAQAMYTSANGICSTNGDLEWHLTCPDTELSEDNWLLGDELSWGIKVEATLNTTADEETVDLLNYTIEDTESNQMTLLHDEGASLPIKVNQTGVSWSSVIRGTKVKYVTSSGDTTITILSDGSPEDDAVDVITAGGSVYSMTGVGSTATFDGTSGDLETIRNSSGTVLVQGPSFVSSTSAFNSSGGGGGFWVGSQTKSNDKEDLQTEATDSQNALFVDIIDHWAKKYINELYALNIVDGVSQDKFEPNRSITRAEMAKVVWLSFYGSSENITLSNETVPFSDVSTNEWFSTYVSGLKEMGIVDGYTDGSFHPNDPVNRAECLKMITAALGVNPQLSEIPFLDVDQSSWYAPYVSWAYSQSIVSGKNAETFASQDFITRAEMAKIIVNSLDYSK